MTRQHHGQYNLCRPGLQSSRPESRARWPAPSVVLTRTPSPSDVPSGKIHDHPRRSRSASARSSDTAGRSVDFTAPLSHQLGPPDRRCSCTNVRFDARRNAFADSASSSAAIRQRPRDIDEHKHDRRQNLNRRSARCARPCIVARLGGIARIRRIVFVASPHRAAVQATPASARPQSGAAALDLQKGHSARHAIRRRLASRICCSLALVCQALGRITRKRKICSMIRPRGAPAQTIATVPTPRPSACADRRAQRLTTRPDAKSCSFASRNSRRPRARSCSWQTDRTSIVPLSSSNTTLCALEHAQLLIAAPALEGDVAGERPAPVQRGGGAIVSARCQSLNHTRHERAWLHPPVCAISTRTPSAAKDPRAPARIERTRVALPSDVDGLDRGDVVVGLDALADHERPPARDCARIPVAGHPASRAASGSSSV